VSDIGLIIGSGFDEVRAGARGEEAVGTPYGAPSSPVLRLAFGDVAVATIARHGIPQAIAPHAVNYRANVWALHAVGVRRLIAVNVVGAIAKGFAPGDVAIPDQIIDYTWGRESSFGAENGGVRHVDVTEPFDPRLCARLVDAAAVLGRPVRRGVYGVTQGPRLETAAEVDRLERDGCAMVGMTAMPEAALARELDIAYAICAVAVNYAAGRSPAGLAIHAELERSLALGIGRATTVLERLLPALAGSTM